MKIAVILLSILSMGLFLFLLLLKREIISITKQLHASAQGVKKPLDVVFIDRRLTELAASINENQALLRQEHLHVLRREQALREAISNISHDLRTPLTSLTGYLQLLQKTGLTAEQAEFTGISLSRARYLQTLIQSFYDISLLENEDSAPALSRIPLYHILTDIVLSFTEQMEEKGITPAIALQDTSACVMADETMLKRILTNLAANAIHYGTNRLQITVTEGDLIIICFENEIADGECPDVERMFERLYTADASRSRSGSGLGLYIVKLLAERMGGNVSANLTGRRLLVRLALKKA